MKIEQFVMAYSADQDMIRAMLPSGFTSLRPVLRINTEIRDERYVYVEFNVPVESLGKRGWLNIGNWNSENSELAFSRNEGTVRIESPLLTIEYKGVGIEGGCPAEKDNDGCFFIKGETLEFKYAREIKENKEFCDCEFAWHIGEAGAHGKSIGKTLPAYYEEPVHALDEKEFTVENAAVIPCRGVLGAYIVRFREDYEFYRRTERIMIGEEAFAYDAPVKTQGEYDAEDYDEISEDRRIELIDGVIYDMASPAMRHQALVGALYLEFAKLSGEHGGCELFLSPMDVKLDEKTIVQPDLLALCRPFEMGKRVEGAPDFVLEVLSESTAAKDCILKLEKYRAAGCREYWIVDGENQWVITYDFCGENSRVPRKYTFDETVPLAVTDGKLCIDFKIIREKLSQSHDA